MSHLYRSVDIRFDVDYWNYAGIYRPVLLEAVSSCAERNGVEPIDRFWCELARDHSVVAWPVMKQVCIGGMLVLGDPENSQASRCQLNSVMYLNLHLRIGFLSQRPDVADLGMYASHVDHEIEWHRTATKV